MLSYGRFYFLISGFNLGISGVFKESGIFLHMTKDYVVIPGYGVFSY
jgi:hypothetical protein